MTSTNSVLMIHGVCCGGEMWARAAGAFRDAGWRVETPTIREEDRPVSSPPARLATLTFADYVADMAAAARRLEHETGRRPVIVGHSLGGLIAQKLAEQQLARAIVLLTPTPPAGIRPRLSLAPLITFANMPLRRRLKVWRRGFVWGMLNRVPRSRHAAIYATARFCSRLAIVHATMPQRDPQRTAHVDETRIRVPVLTIGAAKDRAVPVDVHRRIGAKYQPIGGDYVEFPDSAHWLLDEPGTDGVLDVVHAWLNAKLTTR